MPDFLKRAAPPAAFRLAVLSQTSQILTGSTLETGGLTRRRDTASLDVLKSTLKIKFELMQVPGPVILML